MQPRVKSLWSSYTGLYPSTQEAAGRAKPLQSAVWRVEGLVSTGVLRSYEKAHPPRTPVGPQAWSFCRVLGGGGFFEVR